jgi:lipoprotein NlpD
MYKYVSILVMISILAGCRQTGDRVPVLEAGEQKSPKTYRSVHKVRAGDTLYSIAWRYGMDYRELAKLNEISYPFTIFVDQKLKVSVPKSGTKKSRKSSRKAKKSKKDSAAKQSRKQAKSQSGVKWYWPLEGKVISGFSLKGNINKGLDIAGKNGQAVAAAAAGTVVYAGGGLRGYGKLVIVKHSDNFLSAYGNNSKILVKEGDQVRRGKVIARLGTNGPNESGKEVLHFEIRRDGKPENPLKYLPKKK